MAVGVVVSQLRPGDFVSHQDHRHALAEHQHGHRVFHLPSAELVDGELTSRPFPTAVPTVVIVGAIAVVLAVGLVVLLVVGDEIVEREAVVAGDEVDRCRRAPACIEIGRSLHDHTHGATLTGIPL